MPAHHPRPLPPAEDHRGEAPPPPNAWSQSGHLPWPLTFSYARGLKHAPWTTWKGKTENVAAAQSAFSHRAKMNSLAALGQWKAD